MILSSSYFSDTEAQQSIIKRNNALDKTFSSAFNDAWDDLEHRYKTKSGKEVIIPHLPRHVSVFTMNTLENPTDRSLHEIAIKEKRGQIERKILDIQEDMGGLDQIIKLKLRTIGVISDKLQKRKFKIVV